MNGKIVANVYASNLHVFCKIWKLITKDRQYSLLHHQTFNVKVAFFCALYKESFEKTGHRLVSFFNVYT